MITFARGTCREEGCAGSPISDEDQATDSYLKSVSEPFLAISPRWPRYLIFHK